MTNADYKCKYKYAHNQSRIPAGFFLGGGAHSFFVCRIPVVLESRRSPQGWGWGVHT